LEHNNITTIGIPMEEKNTADTAKLEFLDDSSSQQSNVDSKNERNIKKKVNIFEKPVFNEDVENKQSTDTSPAMNDNILISDEMKTEENKKEEIKKLFKPEKETDEKTSNIISENSEIKEKKFEEDLYPKEEKTKDEETIDLVTSLTSFSAFDFDISTIVTNILETINLAKRLSGFFNIILIFYKFNEN
jgi:hypothetical protein